MDFDKINNLKVQDFEIYINENINSINLDEYHKYLQENMKRGFKGKLKHVEKLLRNINNEGTKSGNGSDETKRLKLIVNNINTYTQWGEKFRKDFFEFYKKQIDRVELKNTKKSHFDLLFIFTDGTTYRCEEKGNKEVYDLFKSNTPWEKAVQRLNGKPRDFIICKIFARIWYDLIVCNNELNNNIGNTISPPPFEEWFEKDCCPTDNPKTEWGINFKKCVKEKWKNGEKKISLNGKNGVSIDGRDIIHDEFLKKFNSNDLINYSYCGVLFTNVKQILKCQIQKNLDNIMNEKDIWMTTCGTGSNIKYRFWNKFNPETILDIDLKHSKGSDFIIKCITKENEKDFDCYLRWGKGCGFSNLRFDIR